MRIGIFGGTFDPPHLGHLILAMEACDQLKLNRLLWMLTPAPPHKRSHLITPVQVRLEMLKIALTGDRCFEISTLEMQRPAPQYAVDTIHQLRHQFPEAKLIYLMGGDSLRDLPDWHQPQELVELADELGVMRRPGDSIKLDELERRLPGLTKKLAFVDAPLLEISSSQIRSRFFHNKAVKYYLTPEVYSFIKSKQLYKAKK
jgi:nicotinate-nucleotide adenylyltransferase